MANARPAMTVRSVATALPTVATNARVATASPTAATNARPVATVRRPRDERAPWRPPPPTARPVATASPTVATNARPVATASPTVATNARPWPASPTVATSAAPANARPATSAMASPLPKAFRREALWDAASPVRARKTPRGRTPAPWPPARRWPPERVRLGSGLSRPVAKPYAKPFGKSAPKVPAQPRDDSADAGEREGERIAKLLARAGVASRREVEPDRRWPRAPRRRAGRTPATILKNLGA
jgi:23S rRNA pseudouridine2605 synthase